MGTSTVASAADPDFCRDYARAAVSQYRQAMEHGRCREQAQGARWSPDWPNHYNWCLGVHRDQAWGERNARTEMLEHCTHHDW